MANESVSHSELLATAMAKAVDRHNEAGGVDLQICMEGRHWHLVDVDDPETYLASGQDLLALLRGYRLLRDLAEEGQASKQDGCWVRIEPKPAEAPPLLCVPPALRYLADSILGTEEREPTSVAGKVLAILRLTPGTSAHVLKLLPDEKENTVRSTLSRLKSQGLVTFEEGIYTVARS